MVRIMMLASLQFKIAFPQACACHLAKHFLMVILKQFQYVGISLYPCISYDSCQNLVFVVVFKPAVKDYLHC